MPVKLSRGERKLVIWVAVGALALVAVVIAFTPTKSDETYFPSSYSPTSYGGKAAFLLLGQMGYTVTRWTKPLSDLPESGAGTVLVMARPARFGQTEQKDALKRYIATGGRVLAFGTSGEWALPHGNVESNRVPETKWQELAPALPSRLTRGGPITTDAEWHWASEDSTDTVHFRSKEGPVVVSYRFGKGEVIWWTSSVPIRNAGISRPGNLELVLNSIGDPRTRVLWNEYSGSQYKSLLQRAWETPVKWLFAQCSLFAVVLLLTYSRRSGPVRAYPVRSRLSPLEFTETLGALYKRAHATGFALEAVYTAFRSQIAKRYGVRRDASLAIVVQSLRERFPELDARFATTLQDIESWIHDSSVSEDQALDLVQRLQNYAAILRLGPLDRREKH